MYPNSHPYFTQSGNPQLPPAYTNPNGYAQHNNIPYYPQGAPYAYGIPQYPMNTYGNPMVYPIPFNGQIEAIEMFSGLGYNESAVEFFRKVTSSPIIHNSKTESAKIKVVGSYLTDSARRWFLAEDWNDNTLLSSENPSFQVKFLGKYLTPEKQALLEGDFWRRQQGQNETACSYYRDKLRLYERYTLDTSDLKFISHVISGLIPLYADMYMGGSPTTLDVLVRGLTNADHRYHGSTGMFAANQVGPPTTAQIPNTTHTEQMKETVPVATPETSLDQLADKLMGKIDKMVEQKVEQVNPRQRYRPSSQFNQQSDAHYPSQQNTSRYRSGPSPNDRNHQRFNQGGNRGREDNYGSRGMYHNNRSCHNCGEEGHQQYECRNPCGICGGDHTSRVCRQSSTGHNTRNTPRPNNSVIARRQYEQHQDNEYEHYQQNDYEQYEGYEDEQDFQEEYHM